VILIEYEWKASKQW